MKKNTWIVIGIIIVGLVFVVPIVIGCGVSADILNDFTNSNDWIGFWGSYSGSVIGGIISGFITMYVLFKTLVSNEEGRIQNEKVGFCNHIVERLSVMLERIEDCMYAASIHTTCINPVERKTTLITFTESIRRARAIVLEITIQIGVRKTDRNYYPEKADELYNNMLMIYNLLEKYNISTMRIGKKGEELEETKKKIEENERIKNELVDLSNRVMNDLNEYLMELIVK